MSYKAYYEDTNSYYTRTDYYTRYGLDKGVWFYNTKPSNSTYNSGNYHTNKTYGMWLASKSIESPEPYTTSVAIPYRDGSIDVTDKLSDEIKYKNRKITIKLLCNRAKADWPNLYTNIANDLHGKKKYIVFDDDMNFYYYGRITVSDSSVDGLKAWVTLEIDAEPYKWRMPYYGETSTTTDPDTGETINAWRWDALDMRYGVIMPYYYMGKSSSWVTVDVHVYKHGKLYIKISTPTTTPTDTPKVSTNKYYKIETYDKWVEVCDITSSTSVSVHTYADTPFYIKVEDVDSL